MQCGALVSSGLGGVVSYPGQSPYEESISSYFSVLEQTITPWCVVQPLNTSQVSVVVDTLVRHDCQFAVRSGGHTPFAGAANIEDGVTIDLGALNSVTYHADAGTAAVGPGATWDDVYLATEAQGRMVVGGRSSTVGVGGLALGGGNSYYAASMGLVCDNVRTFEVVLASGKVVHASLDENPRLFEALKGGSSNLGIVTRLDLATFPNEPLWGGTVLYPNTTASQQFEAFTRFGPNLEEDPYASVIVINTYLGDTDTNVFWNAYEYTKPEPRPAIFDDFLAIPGNISDTMRITNMSSLAQEFENPSTYRSVTPLSSDWLLTSNPAAASCF